MSAPLAPLRITSGLELEGGLAALEPLYRRVFPGGREPAWFGRKLHRQYAQPQCTALAHTGARCTAASVVGFALAGAPPSRDGWWRTSGIGVDEAYRRSGHGRALVAAMLKLSEAAGAPGVETLAPPWLRSFYASLGYRREHADAHLVARGQAVRDALGPEVGVDRPIPADAHRPWTPEAWARTPAHERRVFTCATGQVGLSAEAAGWLAQWWAPGSSTLALATQLRKRVSRNTHLILLGVPANERAELQVATGDTWGLMQHREHHRWRRL